MQANTAKEWALRQIELDRGRTARFPELLARKRQRMAASPFAFLRGAAPLFYELLAAEPALAQGPPGEGWLVGDLHLENFGAFSPERAKGTSADKHSATFNLNDFDEAVRGPLRWDVLRLLTSLILAGRELGVNGPAALALSAQLLDRYADSAFAAAALPQPPAPVATLVTRMQARSRKELLDARTASDGLRRRFVRGDRYHELPTEIAAQVPAAIALYAQRLSADERPHPEQLAVIDAAHRIAGTGSLGVLRIAVLTAGKGGVDGGWIFDLKEQPAPSAELLLGRVELSPSEAAVRAFRACIAAPPRMLATTELGSLGMVARRLTPQEDKLSLREIRASDLTPLAAYLGALVGAAHARGSAGTSLTAWSEADRAELLARAVTLAGMHEAIYLEWCLAWRQAAQTTS